MGQIFSLTHGESERLIGTAIKILKEMGKAATVATTNADGNIVGISVMDGVRPMTTSVARLKAEQSALTGKTTRELRDKVSAGELKPKVMGLDPSIFVEWAGGVPIYDEEGHRLGGLGVSNLSEDEDERVAYSAITREGFYAAPK